MQETRRKRLASLIQEEIAHVVSREIKDPRIPALTFTSVDVTPEGDQATVYFAILGGSQGGLDGSPLLTEAEGRKRAKACQEGLTSSAGFLKRHLAKILTIRHIPHLIFKEDRGLENTLRVNELLKQIAETEGNKESSKEDQ